VFRYETFWRRFWAGVIDSIVFIPMAWLSNWIWGHVHAQPVLATWYIVDSTSFFAYSIVLHGLYGQTIGKRLTGVKIELVTMLTNDRRRALHDFIAGSVVMRVQPEAERMAESPASS